MQDVPCSVQPAPDCAGCKIRGVLMCRFDRRDTLHFLMVCLPFFVTAIGGLLRGGHGWWLLGWLGYLAIFFFWESRILCSHCPYWAEDARILHCHANYGELKIWRYNPQPMSRSERIQFLVGIFLFVIIPVILLLVAREYLLSLIALASACSFIYLLRRNICSRCINFSCPLNQVPPALRKGYFDRNPAIAAAWGGKRNP